MDKPREIKCTATIRNMPYKKKKGFLVARREITVGNVDLWFYGLYDTLTKANEVAVEIRNGIVLEV